MDGQYITIIVFAAIWIVALVVLGVLSLKYKKKHEIFIKERDEYNEKYQKLVETTNLDELVKPIETNIKLPKGEYFYQIDPKVTVFLNTIKEYKGKSSKRKARYDTKQEYREYYGILNLKDMYGIGKSKNKISLPAIKGEMYITNKRITFREKDSFEEIELSEITKCYHSMIYLDVDWYKGFVIQTTDGNYEIVTNKPESVLIINELIKGER